MGRPRKVKPEESYEAGKITKSQKARLDSSINKRVSNPSNKRL